MWQQPTLFSLRNSSKVINLPINLGVGTATETGIMAARKLGCDLLITMDADGQHNPKDIERVIQPILSKKADVVIGTRMKNSKGMPWIRVFGNWMMNLVTFLVFQKWTSDSQSGMKAFGKKALSRIDHRSLGYEICSETIGEIRRNRLKFCEVPIEVIYSSYSQKKGQNIFNAINVLTKIIMIRLAGKR